jgi:lipoate-protein ligase B
MENYRKIGVVVTRNHRKICVVGISIEIVQTL